MQIPVFNTDGLLPSRWDDASMRGNAHVAKPAEVVMRFGTNQKRRRLLKSWLEYRANLRKLPIKNAFQILAGSFVENKEDPSDIDLITAYERDDGWLPHQHGTDAYLDAYKMKVVYACDFLPIDLTGDNKNSMFFAIAFFWSLFSRRKGDRKDKGLVYVPLNHRDDKDDRRAQSALDAMGDDNE